MTIFYPSRLSRYILLYGLINLILSPFIFIWQLLNLFYGYTEVRRIKEEEEFEVIGNLFFVAHST